ncbi:trace amine-associated receptor 13c-like [Betta splendens]|uniref:Trace amine-associated receptor 13c-like n=1 Tax=Betta splendens TaxID=158456 RepID=A0A6P7LBM6_BETSP|nr:trace amine-associated receptor 13c-like [Betta splendens]
MEAQDGAELCFPQLLNASCWKPKRHQSDAVLLYLLFFISALTVVLNLLLHTPTNLLLLSLAVSDFLMGLVVTPLQVYRRISCWYLGNRICSLQGYVSFSIISASIGGMVLISADRYAAICDPLHYSTRVTVSKVKKCVCLCWFCAFIYNIILFREELIKPGQQNSCHGMCLVYIDIIMTVADIALTFVVPFSSIIFLYMRVFLTAVSQARAMRSHVAAVTLHNSGTKRSELKAARTLGVVVAWFLICFLPYYFLTLIPYTLPAVFSLFLLCLSPFLNPVIYALFYPWFRKALRLIFSLQILQPGSCETNVL